MVCLTLQLRCELTALEAVICFQGEQGKLRLGRVGVSRRDSSNLGPVLGHHLPS